MRMRKGPTCRRGVMATFFQVQRSSGFTVWSLRERRGFGRNASGLPRTEMARVMLLAFVMRKCSQCPLSGIDLL